MTKVQRYKVGYYTDEWGMSIISPCLVPADNGYAVKFEDYCKLETELAALKAENESLQKDAARLDWVEHQDFYDLSFAVLVDQPNDGMIAVSIGEGWHLGNNLREAIDAAIAKG